MHTARVAQWIRRRSPKPKIASSSLAVGKIFTHPAVKKVAKNISVSAVGFEPTLPRGNQSLNLAP